MRTPKKVVFSFFFTIGLLAGLALAILADQHAYLEALADLEALGWQYDGPPTCTDALREAAREIATQLEVEKQLADPLALTFNERYTTKQLVEFYRELLCDK